MTSPGPIHLALSPPRAILQTSTNCPAVQVRCLWRGGFEASLALSLQVATPETSSAAVAAGPVERDGQVGSPLSDLPGSVS